MRKSVILALAIVWAGVAASGCAKKETPAPEAQAPTTAPSTETTAAAAPVAPTAQSFTGSVAETMDAGGYTYVQVDTGAEKIWGAAPKFAVAVGDRVTVPATMPMRGYQSKTLNRTFDVVYFAGAILPEGAASAAAASPAPADATAASGHPGGPVAAAPAASMDFSGIPKAKDGRTVGEILSAAADFSGKDITVRGKVVKFNSGIMGKNWLHVQDGTGEAGLNDLTVTTDASAKVGDLVLVRGKAATDKDFGYGYKYAFIVEDADVVVE